MASMNNLIQKLNDKYLDLDQLLTDFDKALADTVEIETYWEDETGRYHGVINTYDEDSVEIIRNLYYRLERIING